MFQKLGHSKSNKIVELRFTDSCQNLPTCHSMYFYNSQGF